MALDALDQADKRILYELDLDSRQSISGLAKKVRLSKETANFRLRRLVKNGFIKGFVTTLHTSNLNRFYYKIFFKFYKTTPAIDAKIIEYIRSYRKTAWFGTFEGPFDLAFLILAKSLYDLDDFLTEFRSQFGEYILEQEILTMTSVHRFNLKFFHQGKKELHTGYPKELKEPKIDSMDYEIIRQIANNSRISALELAKGLKVDPGTVIYRYKRLKRENILGSHVLAVDFDKFDMQHFQVNFKLMGYGSIRKLIAYFSLHKNATFATVTLGRYDLAIEFVVKDNGGLKTILDDLKAKFSDEILDHDTFLITKEYNVSWFPYQSDD